MHSIHTPDKGTLISTNRSVNLFEASRSNFSEITETLFCNWLDPTYAAMWHRTSISGYMITRKTISQMWSLGNIFVSRDFLIFWLVQFGRKKTNPELSHQKLLWKNITKRSHLRYTVYELEISKLSDFISYFSIKK